MKNDQLQTFKKKTSYTFFAALPFTAFICYTLLITNFGGYNAYSLVGLALLVLSAASLIGSWVIFEET